MMMNDYLMVASMLVFAQTADDALWKQLASYGALGAIVVFLIWERVSERKLDRKIRHEQNSVIHENTLATHQLSSNIKQLTSALYLYLGRRPPPDEPPTPSPKPRNTEETL